MVMNAEGSKAWARLTKENIGRQIAIVLDEMVYSAPNVNDEITHFGICGGCKWQNLPYQLQTEFKQQEIIGCRLVGRQSKTACTGGRQHDTPAAD